MTGSENIRKRAQAMIQMRRTQGLEHINYIHFSPECANIN
jgi:hypothetical protein